MQRIITRLGRQARSLGRPQASEPAKAPSGARLPFTRLAALRLLVSASALAMGVAVTQAQTLGLRGTTQQAAAQPASAKTRTGQAESAPQAVPYVPSSQADDQAPGGPDIFVDAPPVDDTFATDPSQPPRRPTTATARRKDAQTPAAAPAASARPAVDEDTTGSLRVRPEQRFVSDEDLDLARQSERLGALEQRPAPRDDSPFAPVGVRLGTFILRPSVEQGVTATTNADSSVNGRSAVLSETTLRLNAVSDWSRHQATLDAYGTFRKSLSDYDLKDTRIGVDAALNLDLADDLSGRLTAGYQRRPETASSPTAIEGTLEQPTLQVLTGSAGLRKEVGKARFGVTGNVERETYGDAELSTGGTISQADRDDTLYTLTLRGGYEVSPALTPFVEGEIGRRDYDQTTDSAGYRRSSDRLGLRAGVELAVSEKLNGELSAGYLRESFDDDRLRPIDGPSINADLVWSPVRGTNVGLAASSQVEGATTAGESGSVLHSATLRLDREIRRDLTAYASVGAGYRDYTGTDGHDTLFNAELGTTWWLNRYAGITGRLRHERLASTFDYRGYDANSVFLGLKVQR